MSPFLRRQAVIIPLSVLFGFLLAYVGFKNGLHRAVFGSPYDIGGGYNSLGRIQPAGVNVTRIEKVDVTNSTGKEEVVPDGTRVKDLAVAVENRTLGFGKLFVVNEGINVERKDSMVLASSFSKLKVEWIESASDATREAKELQRRAQSNWRAHVNAMRTAVEQGLPSALVLEDDLDWDIRLKEQMHTFALSTRTLTQPLTTKDATGSMFADPTFPDPSSSKKVTEIPYQDRPVTVQPTHSAYGDYWDVLWLGHCGMGFPTQNTPDLSRGRVVLTPDSTVAFQDTTSLTGNTPSPQTENYTEQTRIYHHTYAPECSLAYAVSQRGARRILYEALEGNVTEGFDGVLRRLCEGTGEGEAKLVCVTTQPSLFSRWRPSNGGSSEHVRWSVRLNVGRYVRGDEREWVDQYPD